MSIYVVDDNIHLCEFMAYLLSRQGYRVHAFTCPERALAHVLSKGTSPWLLVSDFNLPKMSGFELHQMMSKDAPKLRTIIISGRRIMDEIGNLQFLQKPFSPDQLLKLVHAYKQSD